MASWRPRPAQKWRSRWVRLDTPGKAGSREKSMRQALHGQPPHAIPHLWVRTCCCGTQGRRQDLTTDKGRQAASNRGSVPHPIIAPPSSGPLVPHQLPCPWLPSLIPRTPVTTGGCLACQCGGGPAACRGGALGQAAARVGGAGHARCVGRRDIVLPCTWRRLHPAQRYCCWTCGRVGCCRRWGSLQQAVTMLCTHLHLPRAHAHTHTCAHAHTRNARNNMCTRAQCAIT